MSPTEFLSSESYRRDLGQIEALFTQAFGRGIPREFLVWRYLENPAGGPLVCVTREDGLIIGSYSASPVYLDCAGERRPSALSMTTMTHPAHNGKGIFKTLATALYERMSGEYDMVWGFPNAKSHFAFVNRLAWKDIYEVPTLALRTADVRSDALAGERDDDFQCDYAPIPRRQAIAVRKDRDYLRWRYGRNPINRYQNFVLKDGGLVTSFAVTKVFADGLDLVDLQAADDEQADRLIAQVVQHAKASDLKAVSTWCPVHASSHKVFERFGFENAAPVTYLGARALGADLPGKDWYDPRNWYLQMGDSDVY